MSNVIAELFEKELEGLTHKDFICDVLSVWELESFSKDDLKLTIINVLKLSQTSFKEIDEQTENSCHNGV